MGVKTKCRWGEQGEIVYACIRGDGLVDIGVDLCLPEDDGQLYDLSALVSEAEALKFAEFLIENLTNKNEG